MSEARARGARSRRRDSSGGSWCARRLQPWCSWSCSSWPSRSLNDKFLTPPNLESIVTSVAVLGVIALAVNQVVLCGEIDISTGSMLGLCAVAAGAVAAQTTGGFVVPLLAGVAVGALAGALNGALVTLGRIPSIIVTLGMLYALRGVILLVTGGTWITGVPNAPGSWAWGRCLA